MIKGRIFCQVIFLLMTMSALTPAAAAGLLEMNEAEQQLLGIEVQAVAPAPAGSAGELTLRVGFSPDGEWAIKTPLPGVLQHVWVQVGDRVRAGDPLVMLRSPEGVSLQRDFLKAGAEMTLQESAWTRDKQLSEAGSVSNRRWQETLYAYETARAEFAGLKAELKLAGFSEADLQRLSRDTDISPDITLRAPVDAIVLQRPAMLGDRLEGTELLARLGEPDKLVLNGMLSSQAAAHLAEGMNIIMQGTENKAVITLVSSVIDPDTQTILVRAQPVSSAGLVPGQLTRWNIQSGSDLLIVPSSAIVKLDGLDVAYVQVANGFEPRPVDVRGTGTGAWIVLGGLARGEHVAVSGTAVLKGMSVGMGGGDG
jgi:cobalt-zinc-cadmium efflux system membrane fusion protein